MTSSSSGIAGVKMKVNFTYILVFISILLSGLLAVTPVSAQDENDPVANEYKDLNKDAPDLNLSDDKSLLVDHDHPSKFRDSTHMRSIGQDIKKVKSNDQSKPSASKEDDALSFNFLYYIIQKFKISDLVDDDD